ncbi:MAG: YHS domain-containing protein [Planctomycetota bacterium]|jgi:YHS domain-containing protein
MKAKLLIMGLIGLAVGVMLMTGCESKTEPEVKACGPDCTKPCCVAKETETKACAPGCTKPCCTGEAKSCPAGCTKPCCAAKTAEAAVEGAIDEATEQTVCPVMKAPINKDLFVEYQGKKVYFCCPGCEVTFQKDPAKYVKDLPQFQE